MAGLFVLIGFVLLVLGVIALFKPMPKLFLKTRGMAAIAIVLSVVSCGIGGSMMPPSAVAPATPADEPVKATPVAAPVASPEVARPRVGVFTKISAAEYAKIDTGMTYAQVVEIIGEPGEEISRSDMAGYTTVAYSWKNAGGANAMLMFQNDALIQKSQFGLH